jgi:hypothetical protein
MSLLLVLVLWAELTIWRNTCTGIGKSVCGLKMALYGQDVEFMTQRNGIAACKSIN